LLRAPAQPISLNLTTNLTLPPLPNSARRVVVAFSGGLDSSVLLHVLAVRATPGLCAVHVHHGLQAVADDWAQHCADFCADLKVPLVVVHANIDPLDPAGPEGAARQARYDLLRAQLDDDDLLVTAHHRDDQAETVLLRLLRGSGVYGLAAMRALTPFTPGYLWRPLLACPRVKLQHYAEAQGLRWLEDPHNADPRYARSWLRAQVLPDLRRRWPQADASLARTARLADEAAGLLDDLAETDHTRLAQGAALSVAGLLALTVPRRHNLLHWWLRRHGFDLPAAVLLDQLDRDVLAAAPDAMPLLAWPGAEVRRYRDRLFVMAPLLPAPVVVQEWREGVVLPLSAGCGRLVADRPPPVPLRVRPVAAGTSFQPYDAPHHRSCRNLFQEAGTPPWLRTRVPLLEIDGKPACIAGIAVSREWRELLAQSGWRPVWQHGFVGLESPLTL